MSLRRGGGRFITTLLRVLLGERPKYDHDFDTALDAALTREKDRERRLAALQDRLDVLRRK